MHNPSIRFLARATFVGRSREVAMDVVRGWAHKSIACGLYGGAARPSDRPQRR